MMLWGNKTFYHSVCFALRASNEHVFTSIINLTTEKDVSGHRSYARRRNVYRQV